MSMHVTYRLTLCTEYGELENVPLQCVIHHVEDGPIPIVAWIHGLRLSVEQLKSMVGADEWDRQMAFFDQWWADNQASILFDARCYDFARRTAAE
jgi:hypothetical protein